MQQEKPVKKSRPLLFFFQLLAALSSLTMLYFLYQAQILPIHLFGLITIFYLILVALLIIISRKINLLVILLVLDILLDLALTFVFYKYNDYFSQIGKNETYYEKYSLVTLKDSNLAKSTSENITPLGILTSDPYFKPSNSISLPQTTTAQNFLENPSMKLTLRPTIIS